MNKAMAAEVAHALGGAKLTSDGWRCRCPLADEHNHGDADPSLTIAERDGNLLVHCQSRHANQQDRIIAALKERGLWPTGTGAKAKPHAAPRPTGDISLAHALGLPGSSFRPVLTDAERIEIARRIWGDTKPAAGTTAERYLKLRGITSPLPPSIRFTIGCHAPSQRGPWAIMVAAVQNLAGEITGIHRTFLTGDGRKAPVEPVKMAFGPIRGGAVRLAPASETLALAEGIETALSIQQATGIPTWAALGTSNITRVELPNCVREVIICADGDPAGERAAHAAAHRLIREGRTVRIARPEPGTDFNDMISVGK